MSKKQWVALAIIFLTLIIAVSIILTERYSHRISSRQPSNFYLHKRIKKYAIQGIDVSHHQGNIAWQDVKHADTTQTIQFAFIRATVGTDKDRRFQDNWKDAGSNGLSRGAYHYYWSDVNSSIQAAHFIQTVSLVKGDLPPVLDIEDVSNIQDKRALRKGLKNWIKIIEAHYGVRPIIYSGEAFYTNVLKTDAYFKEYPRIWIANYNVVDSPRISWDFWQYTDRLVISGIQTLVDGNVFIVAQVDFEKLLIP
jgi:lysozyme